MRTDTGVAGGAGGASFFSSFLGSSFFGSAFFGSSFTWALWIGGCGFSSYFGTFLKGFAALRVF